MKAIAAAALACTMIASVAAAGQMNGGGGGPNGNRGWGSNSGVYVGLPPSMFDGSNNGGIPPPDPNEIRCRDARHICFDQWGVDEPGYGRCMTNRGC